MSGRLKGKRAFVTAAAAGIGRASAIAFAREGATVIATDIDDKQLAALTKEGVAEVARLDARDSDAVAAMAKQVGTIDVLLNAAGFVHHGTVLECSDDDWDFSFDLNVKSMHRTLRAFLPGMLAAKTSVPVLGVPVQSQALNGMDSLLSIVQMPAGVPVATFAIGKAGATNAALFAAALLAADDAGIAQRLDEFRAAQTDAVLAKSDPRAS